MRRIDIKCLLTGILTLLMLSGMAFGQGGSVSGVVTDASSGEGLPGANVVLEGTTMGAATDVNGRYEISNVPAGSYVVIVTYIGYQTKRVPNIAVTGGASATANISLDAEALGLNAVTVSASRRPEKTLDAPASVSVVDTLAIRNSVGLSSADALKDVVGVDVARSGVDRQDIVLRGFNNAFSGSAYVLTDYRQAAVPALAVNIHSIMPNISIDLDRVEVVRGPGSALYGPGVDAGVIHYLTQNPFDYPGTTVSISGGERSAMFGSFRTAHILSENVALKLTGQYGQADDWELDPANEQDSVQLSNNARERTYDYKKYNVNGMLQFRLSDDASLTFAGGQSALTANVLTGIGTTGADNFGYRYGQARLQAGRFFLQTYFNQNDAGDSFVYGTNQMVVDKGRQINVQTQYDFDMTENQSFIVGADLDNTRPDTEMTIYGRNEENDEINEVGAYLQSLTRLGSKLDLTVALRGDFDNIVEEFQVSPRVGVVFKPNGTNSLRATYNRAFSLPGNNSLFLDILAGAVPRGPMLTPITVRGRGSKDGYEWERNANFEPLVGTDLVMRSIAPGSEGVASPAGLPLNVVYDQVYAGLAAIPTPTLRGILLQQGIDLPEAVVGALVQLLSPTATAVGGFSPGDFGILNLSTRAIDPIGKDLSDAPALQHTTTQTYEVGYKGFLGGKVLFAVDGYYTKKENFIGPLTLETPFVTISEDFVADLTAALAGGITGNQPLADALAANGLTPEAVAGLVVGLAQQNPEFLQPGTPIGVISPVENLPADGALPELLLFYRNFGEVDFLGLDVALQVFVNERLSLMGNMSFVSDDFFDNEDLGESNDALALALNAPTFKAKLGFSYNVPKSYTVSASGRFTKGFPVLSGPYVGGLPEPYGDGTGGVEDYFLLDVNLGYDMYNVAPGLRVDVSMSNILNNEHRQFVGSPLLGRMVMGRLNYSF